MVESSSCLCTPACLSASAPRQAPHYAQVSIVVCCSSRFRQDVASPLASHAEHSPGASPRPRRLLTATIRRHQLRQMRFVCLMQNPMTHMPPSTHITSHIAFAHSLASSRCQPLSAAHARVASISHLSYTRSTESMATHKHTATNEHGLTRARPPTSMAREQHGFSTAAHSPTVAPWAPWAGRAPTRPPHLQGIASVEYIRIMGAKSCVAAYVDGRDSTTTLALTLSRS